MQHLLCDAFLQYYLQETAASGSGDEFSVDHVFTYTEDLVYAGVG